MKRIITFFMACSCLALYAQQQTAQVDDVNYQLNADGTAAVIATPDAQGDLLIPENITVGDKTYTVTEIDDKAFKGCRHLTSIVLPATLQHVYRSAFDGTGVMQNKDLWNNGALILDGVLVATNKNIKAKYVVPQEVRLMAIGAFENNKTVTNVVLHDGLTIIDHNMFMGCKNLAKINVPLSVTWIGQDVLTGSGIYTNEKKWRGGKLIVDNCLFASDGNVVTDKNIFKVKKPIRLLAIRAFANCKKLKNVTIPTTITSIPTAAFYQCEGLKTITIPATVESVGMYAFYGCTNLKEATLPADLKELGAGAFYGCGNLEKQVLSSAITTIPKACFFTCHNLKDIEIPSTVIAIEDGAFAGCAELEKITLPEGLEKLGEEAFAGCLKLEKIVIPEKIVTVSKGAFRECSHLLSVDFPQNLYAIDDEAFKGCLQLEKIALPKMLFRVGTSAFEGCQNMVSLSTEQRLYTISDRAFYGCIRLEEISFYEMLEELGVSAFEGCINLRKVRLNDRLLKVSDNAFAGCRTLEELHLPEYVVEIGANAFRDCKELSKVTWPQQLDLETIGHDAFNGCIKMVIPELDEYVNLGKNAFLKCKPAVYADEE